ncbi:MAG: ThuA domain-containing protein [Deltaproteobacteria bacterium]
MKIFKRILLGLGAVAVLLVLSALIFLRMSGAWNVIFPSDTHETVAPELPVGLAEPAVLLFTKTNSFRHVGAIKAGVSLWEKLAEEQGFAVFHTENGAILNPDDLARFDVVIFHNATGDMFDEAQQAAFQGFLEAGGGWIGVHAAGDSSHGGWRWYIDSMIGGLFTAHTMGPQFQEARLVVEDAEHPATRNLPAAWQHVEEWYSWDANPRDSGFQVLVTVDESTYEPVQRMAGMERDLRMGDHPVVWTACVGSGRTFYSALGHAEEAYETEEMHTMLGGALAWASGQEGKGCE